MQVIGVIQRGVEGEDNKADGSRITHRGMGGGDRVGVRNDDDVVGGWAISERLGVG